jgi:hypothetical protein
MYEYANCTKSMQIFPSGPAYFVLIELPLTSDDPYFPDTVIRYCAWSVSFAGAYSLQKWIRHSSSNCIVAKEIITKTPKLF